MAQIFNLTLNPNTWVNLNNTLNIDLGTILKIQNTGTKWVYIAESELEPVSDEDGVYLTTLHKENPEVILSESTTNIWVKPATKDHISKIAVQTLTRDHGLDPRVQSGGAALTVQSYDESNKKAGVQWEASRLVKATNATYYYSVIVTGDKPVDLKLREFAYTDLGLIGYIYKNPTYTGGTPDQVYNMTDINPVVSGIQLLTGITIANPTQIPTNSGVNAPAAWGTPFGAPIYAIGPVSNQTSGATTQAFASNRILAPNTEYLLVFYSRSAQEITARLEWYEGDIDRNGGGLIV